MHDDIQYVISLHCRAQYLPSITPRLHRTGRVSTLQVRIPSLPTTTIIIVHFIDMIREGAL